MKTYSKFNKNNLRKSNTKVLMVLVLVTLITASVSWLLSGATKEQLQTMADNDADKSVKKLKIITSMDFFSSEWVICSYLSSWLSVELDSVSPNKINQYKFVLSDDKIKHLKVERLHEGMMTFMKYNEEYASCVLLFEPNAMAQHPDGIVNIITADTIISPQNKSDYIGSDFYDSVAQYRGMSLKAGSKSEDHEWTLTNAVPLIDKNGRVLGEFWVDTKIEEFSKILSNYQADEDVLVGIISDDNLVVSCTHDTLNGFFLEPAKPIEYGKAPKHWCNQVRKCLQKGKKSFFKDRFFDHTYYTYIEPIPNTPFDLLIIKPRSKIYQTVNQFQWIVFAINIVQILLLTICMIYIYVIVRRKTEENEHIKAEMNVAARIQRGILPPNPGDTQVDNFKVYGFQKPAKSVGGDLYDFVLKDNYLHFCIGDVSGKGIPAAMLMTELCSLYRYIIAHYTDPQKIVSKLNNAVMERSDDSMFCTLFVGVLNLETGHVDFCNAGHNPPILIRKNEPQAKYLTIKPNMPVYAFENYKYQKESLTLNDGDRLFLYTDGVTEAKNTKNKFFGTQATLSAVQQFSNEPFDKLVCNLLANVDNFTQKAEQNDDITILCLEYKNLHNRKSLHYDSVKNNVVNIVNDILSTCNLLDDTKLRLAVEEPIQNVSEYSYNPDGPLDVIIINDTKNNIVDITLIDKGLPFNPLLKEFPNLDIPIEEREIGGLGIFFTRKIMNEVSYKFENQQNKLNLKYKKI